MSDSLGGIKLDMRDASFAEAETVIKAVAVMGGMEITVPEDAEVEVGAFGVMGGVDHGGEGPGAPGAPRIRNRRRGDGRHRGQARPGPAIIPG